MVLNLLGLIWSQVCHRAQFWALHVFFLIYINDLFCMLSNPCLLCADDTKIYNHIRSEDDVCKLKQDIVKLEKISDLKCGRCLLMFPSAKFYTWVELTPTMCIAWLAVTLIKPMKKETYRSSYTD